MKNFKWYLIFCFMWASLGFVAFGGLKLEQSGANLHLYWDANPESDLAGYRIYSAPTSGGPYTKIGEIGAMAAPEFPLPVLQNGRYFFVVSAFNKAGLESGYSNEVSTTVALPPQNPGGLRFTIQKLIAAILAWLHFHREV